jgi:hypothetical protein
MGPGTKAEWSLTASAPHQLGVKEQGTVDGKAGTGVTPVPAVTLKNGIVRF